MATPTSTAEQAPLKTISATGKVPKRRLDSAKEAQDIYWRLRESSQYRQNRAAVIQGMFDGNQPYDAAKFRQSGQSYRANFNTLEGAARKDAAKTPYYDLFSTAQLYAEARTEVSTDKVGADEATRIRSEEFDRLLRSWPGFDQNIWTMLDDFVGFNKGFFWWPNTKSWHFRRIPWHRVLFPSGTSYDTEEWEYFAVEHQFPVHRLWNFVKDENTAAAAGWNREQVIRAVAKATPRNSIGNTNDPMSVQQSLRDSDLYLSSQSSTVQCASIFVREFDGKWTRMMVETETETFKGPAKAAESPMERAGRESRSEDSKIGDKDFLYLKTGVADEVQQLIATFFYDLGDGSINALEGLGKRIVSVMQLKDRMRNEQANNVLLRSTVLIQPQSASASVKAGLIHFGGGVTVVPPGYNAIQSTVLGDIESTLAVNNDLDRMLDVNTGVYRPQFEKPQGNPESATAASLRFSQATVLTNSAVSRFYQQLDRFYQELYRRASMENLQSFDSDPGVQAALRFQERCKKRGLSQKQISDSQPGLIRAVRTIGNGSPIMRQQMVSAVAGISQFLGQRGLKAWVEDYVAAFGGQSKVDRWLPDADRNELPSQDDWEATRENNDMQQGAPPLLVEEQNHEVHAVRHVTTGFAAIQAVQQGGDPTSAGIFLQIAIPHIQEHAARIGRENTRKQVEQAIKELERAFGQIQQMLQKQAQQRQQQSNLTFEQQLKAQDTQAKLAERQAKLEQQLQQKQAKFEQDQALSDATTAAAIQRQGAMTAAQIRAQSAKTNQSKSE